MVSNAPAQMPGQLRAVTGLVVLYVLIVVGTVVALGVLSAVEPRLAPTDAWVHAVIVVLFAVVLPFRLRAARKGSRRALRATGLIAGALFLVNVVEALIPALFPVWMRVQMVGIAVLMAALILMIVRESVAGGLSKERA